MGCDVTSNYKCRFRRPKIVWSLTQTTRKKNMQTTKPLSKYTQSEITQKENWNVKCGLLITLNLEKTQQIPIKIIIEKKRLSQNHNPRYYTTRCSFEILSYDFWLDSNFTSKTSILSPLATFMVQSLISSKTTTRMDDSQNTVCHPSSQSSGILLW